MPAGATDKSPRPRRRGRPPGPTVDRAQRREEILEAAIQAIRTLGSGASMDKLAAAAGITKPILYDHFGDKAGLARALADRVADDIRERLAEVFQRDSEPREITYDGIATFLEFIESEPELYQFLVQGLQPRSDATVTQRRLVTKLAGEVAESLGSHLAEMGADTSLAVPWAFGIIGTVIVAAEWWLATREIDAQQLGQALTDLIWDGVGGVRPQSGAGGA